MTLTGRTRYRTRSRWFGPPLLVLQVEFTYTHTTAHYDHDDTAWRDARVEDLPISRNPD